MHRNKRLTLLILAIGIFAGLGAFGYGAFKNRSFTSTEVKSSAAGGCTVDAKLVNSCRPWIGAAVWSYTMAPLTVQGQFDFFEKRLNNPNVLNNPNEQTTITNKLDFMHTYHVNNDISFDQAELAFINRSNSYLQLNYKPDSASWATAGGSNSTVNTRIDNLAQSIKNVAPNKVMLSIWHEPEDNVTEGSAGACNTKAGANTGTPAEYKQMWRNVRNRFDAIGVNNVVWNMNYMGFSNWHCVDALLYPGNDLVDWITWDPYSAGTQSFSNGVSEFYNFLSNNSNSTNDYLSKAWGLSEHGYWNQTGTSTEAQAPIYWQQAKTAIDNNTFPRIKLYSVFDTAQAESLTFASLVGLQFNATVTPNVAEQTAYNAFANTIFSKEVSLPANNADLNVDSKVNVQDLSILISKWGTNSQPADINKDSIVNVQDLSILISKWTG